MNRQNQLRTIRLTRAAIAGTNADGRSTPTVVRDGELGQTDTGTLEVPVPIAGTSEVTEVRVLHVDDDPDILDVTATFLERNDDFVVHTETTVVEALDHLADARVDCIVSDYQMPRTDGLEFLAQVRERHPDLPFVLYTGRGSEEIASEAIAAGVTDYMQKTADADQYEVLSNRIRNAVDRYRTQEQFWDALSWYRRLVEQGIAGVFVVQDGQVVYLNERLADLFGYERADLVGAPFEQLVAGPDRGSVLGRLRDPTGETDRFAFTARHRDGRLLRFDVTGGPTDYDGEKAVTGIVREVTD